MFDRPIERYSLADITITTFFVLTVAYFYIRYTFTYWQRRGVVTPLAASFPLGNFGKSLRQQCTLGELMTEFYHSTTAPFLGVYAMLRPMFIVRDLELVRRVLTKDFHHFEDRGFASDENVDFLTTQLFMARSGKWRQIRAKLTPAFTSGKLKAMFPTLLECSVPFQQYLEQFVDRNESVEMRDLAARYSTNVIASTAFGIEINCIENLDDDFRKYGRMAFDLTVGNGLRQIMSFVAPSIMETMRIRTFDKRVAEFMTTVVEQNMKYREENNVTRKDFFQLLLQIRNGGDVRQDDDWTANVNADDSKRTLSLNDVVAQTFLFFIAGFETTSAAVSFCLYELAKQPAVQERLHADIDRVLDAHDGQLTYDTLGEMKYLDCCLDGKLWKITHNPTFD